MNQSLKMNSPQCSGLQAHLPAIASISSKPGLVSASQVSLWQKGQWKSGSVINYKQITSYKDPSPPMSATFFATPGEPHKSAAESPQLSANTIPLHGQVHPLSACLISAPMSDAAEMDL